MRKIIEYSIAEGANHLKLAKAVNMAIQDGFEPVGEIIVVHGDDVGPQQLLQQVVKYDSESWPPAPMS